MRKEVIFAIIIGLILGLVILFGVRLANQSSTTPSSISPTPTDTSTPTPTQASLGISITSPENHSVVSTSTIKIIGQTLPNSPVALTNSEDDTLISSDNDGKFSVDLKLAGGENIITATVLAPDQTTQVAQISIIYTTAKIN